MGGLTFPHGFYQGEWQKSPIPFGVSSAKSEEIAQLGTAAGLVILDGEVVPEGEIWVATNILMTYNAVVAGTVLLASIFDIVEKILFEQNPPIQGMRYDRQGQWVISEGMNFRYSIINATAGAIVRLNWVGYKIDVSL